MVLQHLYIYPPHAFYYLRTVYTQLFDKYKAVYAVFYRDFIRPIRARLM